MVTTLVISVIIAFFSEIFSMFPVVTALPTIGGYNIDAALQSAAGEIHQYVTDVWVVRDVLIGALVLWGYYGIKMILKIVLGSRAPGGYN